MNEVKITSSELSQSQKEFTQKTVMYELGGLKDDIFFKHAEKINFDPTSDEYSWRLYKDLPETTDHLIEGVTPAGLKYSLVDFVTKVYQEGNFVPLTDKMLKYGLDKQLAISGKLLGKNAKNRMRSLLISKIFNGLNVKYANGAANRAGLSSSSYKFKLSDVNAIGAYFKRRGVEPFEDGFYRMVISPEVEADVRGDTSSGSLTDIEKYRDTVKIEKGEIGAYGGFRFIVSNDCLNPSTNVHCCLAFGKEAFGAVAIDGEDAEGGFEIIYKAPGSSGSSDPLNQRGSLAWKHDGFGTRILREEALVRYEVYGSAVGSAVTDSQRDGYRSASGAIVPTLTKGTHIDSIEVVGNVAPGALLKVTAKAGSGYHLASTVWTVASFVGVDVIQGAATDASIFVQVKKSASSVTLVAANAEQDA